MIYIAFVMVTFVIVFIIIWKCNFDKQRALLCEKHQKEWDKIKNELLQKGATEIEVFDKYNEYIEHLMKTRHETYGACFPRK